MGLQTGARFGPYEILAPLGAGGMGEVYRARDTKLDRDVAVKVLPPHLAENATALARFEREAKAVAALSHPNILAIFDFGVSQGTAYAVMELLEGETLRGKLSSPVPVRKALDYAIQIARGLGAAHSKGIVHRDLKPENVFVLADGQVKILDFGLARQTLAFAGAAETLATMGHHSEPGVVMGTVGYMSPEQVRGEAVDSRSDLFSFGCVLYELLAGRRAFQRDTAAETMTAVLKEDPPELPLAPAASGVAPGLARIVERCLEKNPAERFQSASDAAFALEAVSGTSTGSVAALAGAQTASSTRRSLAPVAGVLALAAIAAAFFAGRFAASGAPQVSYTAMTHHQQTIFRALFVPGSQTVVFSAADKGSSVELFSATAEYPEAKSFGLHDVHLLSVSSKSELAVLTKARYVTHRLFVGTLARMPLGGGAPREILENVREADWSPDGERLAIIRDVSGSDRLEFPAGHVLFETAGYVSDLRVSPDGQHVAFFEHPSRYDDRGSVAVVDLGGNKKTLSSGYGGLEGLAWSRDGSEVLFSDFKVYAVTLAGRLRQALESAGGLTLYDVSADGRWLAARDDLRTAMWAKAPDGHEINLSWLESTTPRALSPDGRVLLFTEFAYGSSYAVGIRKTDGSAVVRLGDGTAMDLSPDGSRAVALVPGSPSTIVIYPTGAGEVHKLERGPLVRYQTARWFPDGKRLLICGNESSRPPRCYVQDTDGGLPRAITPDYTGTGSVSPDGTVVLVRRGQPSIAELYPVAGGAPRVVAGLESDDIVVRWSPNGRSVIVTRPTLPARAERIDLETGKREPIPEVAPLHAAEGIRFFLSTIADDPSVFAYGVSERLSTLFRIQGAR